MVHTALSQYGALRRSFSVDEAVMLILGLDKDQWVKLISDIDLLNFKIKQQADPSYKPDISLGNMSDEDFFTNLVNNLIKAGLKDIEEAKIVNISNIAFEIKSSIVEELSELYIYGTPTCLEFVAPHIITNGKTDYVKSRISRKSLSLWCKEKGIETTAFEYNNKIVSMDSNSKLSSEIRIKPIDNKIDTNKSLTTSLADTRQLTAKQQSVLQLLDGNHAKQAPELTACLQLWYELVQKIESGKTVNGNKPETIDFLKKNFPKSKASSTTRVIDRIAAIIGEDKPDFN